MSEPLTRGTTPACRATMFEDATYLNGIIRAAVAANLNLDGSMEEREMDLIRNAVDGLLEAAEIISKRLAARLDAERAVEVRK